MSKHYSDIDYEKTIAKKRLVFKENIFETIVFGLIQIFYNMLFVFCFIAPIILIPRWNYKNEEIELSTVETFVLSLLFFSYLWIVYITLLTPFGYIKRWQLKSVKIKLLDLESFWKDQFPTYDYTILNENKLLVTYIPISWFGFLFGQTSIMMVLINDNEKIYLTTYTEMRTGGPNSMTYFKQNKMENKIINTLKEYNRNQIKQ